MFYDIMILLKKSNPRRTISLVPGKFCALHLPAGRQVPGFLSGIMFRAFLQYNHIIKK